MGVYVSGIEKPEKCCQCYLSISILNGAKPQYWCHLLKGISHDGEGRPNGDCPIHECEEGRGD